jgi:hypothetical protein
MRSKSSVVMTVIVSLLIGGSIGWALAKATTKPINVISKSAITKPTLNEAAGVRSLITYTLPSGWSDTNCPGGNVYISMTSSMADCSNASTPVQLSVDPDSMTDCNQLPSETNVVKHTCRSIFISGKKTLEASTQYANAATTNAGKTVETYYYNSGRGVIKAVFVHQTESDSAGFTSFVMTFRNAS